MADRTEIISKFLNNQLSENELTDFKVLLASDKEFFDEFLFQKDLEILINAVYTDEWIENEFKNAAFNFETDALTLYWEKYKNDKENLKFKTLINRLFDEYQNEQNAKEFEILDIELELSEIDKEIEELIDFSDQKKTDENLKSEIKDAFESYENEKKSNPEIPVKEITIKRKFKPFSCAIAASILVLIIFSIIYFISGKTKPNDEIFAENYFTPSSTFKVKSGNTPNLFSSEALDFYDKKDFNTAAEKFLQNIYENSNDTIAYFYLAISYLEIKNYTLAEKYLLECRNKFQLQKPDITWYLALCYLAQNENELAKTEFKKLRTSDTFGERVNDILKVIE